MRKSNYMLLDCTLRDGGYINEWKWGNNTAKAIIQSLVKAGIDIVEVGFLRNTQFSNPDITVSNNIEDLNRLLPVDKGGSIFSAMAMRSNYDYNKLSDYSGHGISMIRVTFHDYDIIEGLEFTEKVLEKGYKVSVNPINIMGYSDEMLLRLIEKINTMSVYQLAIVDTFGSMKRRDLDRIVSIVDNNLDRNIRLALHLHENMSLSYALAQQFIDKHIGRTITIDGSLMGMGRTPGNLPIELIADYLNEYYDHSYDIDYLMDAIQDYIAPIKGNTKWGYSPVYFLSARYNLHRNYAEHYLSKGDLTNRDINHILARIDNDKKTVFDALYADELYYSFKDHRIDDSFDRKRFQKAINDKKVMVMAPGNTINTHYDVIESFIEKEHPIVISINFLPDNFQPDYVFFSNNKRIDKYDMFPCDTIVTSNIVNENATYVFDYNSLTGAFDQGLNSLIMLFKLLKDIGINTVTAVGADGYTMNETNYYDASIRSYSEHDSKFNVAVADAIRQLGIHVTFLTPSKYDIN